ncbi:MAG TPA: cyclic pyranopterin monophosphate synthase MoaC [Baekduia sp.]|nr:cyclic pyranopterin monophosphate synthase MoaC [Baekduia sp.]
MAERLTHLDEEGSARMVDVGAKAVTARRATARAIVKLSPDTLDAVRAGDAPKGDVLGTARIAGIQAAKKTGELIPLCHPLGLDHIEIEAEIADGAVVLTATAAVTARTGVEMEAMTAVAVAALTVYDMVKGLDRSAEITSVQLLAKSGGKSGEWKR